MFLIFGFLLASLYFPGFHSAVFCVLHRSTPMMTRSSAHKLPELWFSVTRPPMDKIVLRGQLMTLLTTLTLSKVCPAFFLSFTVPMMIVKTTLFPVKRQKNGVSVTVVTQPQGYCF
jgi:hypothetical protein